MRRSSVRGADVEPARLWAADLAYGAAALPAVCAGIAWAGVFGSIRGDKFGRAVAVTFVASGLSWVVWRLVGSGLWYEDDALVTRGVFRTRRIPWSSIARALPGR